MIRVLLREGYDFAGYRLYVLDCDPQTHRVRRKLKIQATWESVGEDGSECYRLDDPTAHLSYVEVRKERVLHQLMEQLAELGLAPHGGEVQGRLDATKEFAEKLFTLHERMVLK